MPFYSLLILSIDSPKKSEILNNLLFFFFMKQA